MLLKEHELYIKERVPGMFSLIIPVYKTEHLLKRCIDSIIAQSYKNWEIIVVFDGYYDKSKFNSFDYKKDDRIHFFCHEKNYGACAARNTGMKESKGEYISCFSSDFEMKCGCLVEWAKCLQNNPDCEFVYGGYELMEDADQNYKGGVFNSESFDTSELVQHNYIDGGFPVRADKVPMWDESFKSLNDWEWAINMVITLGYKGYYMHDFISYAAEFPKVGGLSHHSNANWESIYTRICEKHNIKIPDVNVISLTAPFHAKRLAKMFGWHSNKLAIQKKYPYKRIHLLGCFESNMEAWVHLINFYGADNVSVHFIGSDVRQCYEQYPPVYSRNVDRLVTGRIKTFCESQRIADLLKFCNIDADVLPLPVEPMKIKKTRNKIFTVGVYAPGDYEKYSTQLMVQLAHALPMFNFVFFGCKDEIKKSPGLPKNIEINGWVDMEEIYSKIDCLLRITPFDGLPVSAVEAMMLNIPVITNHELAGAIITEHEENIHTSPSVYHSTLNKIIDILFKLSKGDKVKRSNFMKNVYSKEYFATKLGVNNA